MEILDERAGTWRLGKHESKANNGTAILKPSSSGCERSERSGGHHVIRPASSWPTGKGDLGVVNAESAEWARGKVQGEEAVAHGSILQARQEEARHRLRGRALWLRSEARRGRRAGERGDPLRWRF